MLLEIKVICGVWAANHFLKTLQKEEEEIRSELENPKEPNDYD